MYQPLKASDLKKMNVAELSDRLVVIKKHLVYCLDRSDNLKQRVEVIEVKAKAFSESIANDTLVDVKALSLDKSSDPSVVDSDIFFEMREVTALRVELRCEIDALKKELSIIDDLFKARGMSNNKDQLRVTSSIAIAVIGALAITLASKAGYQGVSVLLLIVQVVALVIVYDHFTPKLESIG